MEPCATKSLAAGCSRLSPSSSQHRSATAQVRISEFHYDNAGADVGEADRGFGARGHRSHRLAGRALQRQRRRFVRHAKPCRASCPRPADARRASSSTIPANGIQNGSPDGHRARRHQRRAGRIPVLRRRPFAATNGAASGITATDIGVFEAGTEAAGTSLARDAPACGAARRPVPSAHATTTAKRRRRQTSPASRSRRRARRSTSVARTTFSATAFDIDERAHRRRPIHLGQHAMPSVATVSPTGVVTRARRRRYE